MIKIESKKNKFTYNVYHVTKAFYPKEDIVQTVDEKQEPLVKIHLPEGTCFSLAPEECVQTEDVQEEKRDVTKKVYQFLSKQTGQKLAWGMLTGVRPTKLVMQKIEQGMTKEENFEFLKEQYCVTDKKAQIAYEIACREKALLDRLDCQNGYSLYAGIPFCPSICSYCSFSSSPIAEWKDQVDRYLDAMIKELKATAKLMQGKPLDTVYIGGGTPTTLEADQLDRLLGTIRENFDLEHVLEFTVEAGRPDSITREKLEVIRKYPVTRISVNPQTMQQKTLDLVGRKHTVEDVEQIFHLARELGFDNINMDLIAGLPYEDVESFAHSFDDVYALKPEQLQLGFLKVLKGSFMQEHQEEYGIVHKAHPPYEVLYTKWISYEDVLRLKGIEEMVEVYYNSRQFTNTMEELEKEYDSAFTMYDRLASYYEDNGYNAVQHKRSARYEILLNYIRLHHKEKEDLFREVLTYDYYLRENAKSRPEFAGEYLVEKDVARTFYEKEEETHTYLPDYGKYDRNQMRKMTHLEYFKLADTYILFDYQNRNPLNQEARVCKVKAGTGQR